MKQRLDAKNSFAAKTDVDTKRQLVHKLVQAKTRTSLSWIFRDSSGVGSLNIFMPQST